LEIRERLSANLSVAILNVKAAKLSAGSDVEITTRSAAQCPYSLYISFSFGVLLNEEIDLHTTEPDASPLV